MGAGEQPVAIGAGIELTVVIPMRNEAANLDTLFARLIPVLQSLGLAYEVICVDDGSSDDTRARVLAHRSRDPAIKLLCLSRNFGKDIALSAGIDHASGGAVVALDADLQDPPELIPAMVAKWREGYDMVYGQRVSRRGESWVKRLTARLFYRLMEWVTDVPIPRDSGDFRLLNHRALDALARLPERTRFMKGLFAWVGLRQTAILYERPVRRAGATNFSYWRLWNFAIDGITSFSSLPLKMWSYVGVTISALAFIYATFLAFRTIIHGIDVPGYASLMVVVLFLGGVQLITLGIIGEYISRVYSEVKRRPLYLVSECAGLEPRR